MSGFQYKFRVVDYRVIDGDTVDCTFDLGLDTYCKERVRLFGIDAAEIRTKDLEEKEEGVKAKAYLEERLENAQLIEVHSKVFARGKYGRVLGDIYADGENLNVTMLMENIVRPYLK
jgi:endonuclease YncB( thermonuclease family)